MKIIKLKIRDGEGKMVPENVVTVSVERHYSNDFSNFLNKKGEYWRVLVNVYDEENPNDKSLIIHYQDKFKTMNEAINEWQKFVNEWFVNYRISLL